MSKESKNKTTNEKEIDKKQNENNAQKTSTLEKKKFLKLRTIFVLLATVFFMIVATIVLRADYLKNKEVGENYVTVFEQNLKNKATVAGTSFVIAFIITYISNKFIKKGLSKFFEEEKKEMPKLPNKSTAFILGLIAAVLCSLLLTEKFAVFSNAAVFGKTDGVFGADISYYMFSLPFIESVFISLMISTIVLIVYTAFYYIICFNVYFDGVDAETIKKSVFIKQLIAYIMILVVLFAGYIIITSQNIFTGDMMSIQDEDETKLAGAGLTDIMVKVWGYRILAFVIIFAVCRLLKYIKKASFNQCFFKLSKKIL